LNSHFGQRNQRPAGLAAGQRERLQTLATLDPDELTEIDSGAFTTLDAHYLDCCFLLRDAARALLAEARDSSVKALAELRALVRGIHPPVLADRGLTDAVQALTLDTPLRIHLASDLYGRPPAPVESAAYFAVSELLANVSKHAEARQTWIDIRHTDGMLRIGVADNGHGGADPARGSGLRGIERRLTAFDGIPAISSPPGGPTAVTMEIPCELSLPKTSFS